MPKLTVPGAILHYETFGTSGPVLVFIPGADGRESIFHTVAEILAASFTVVCWDRRGYSQSYLRLIARVSRDGKAVVFGTSSGAVVAQQLLATHTDCVAKLISHEPPAFGVLPKEFEVQASGLINHIYNTYRAQGPEAAMEVFTSGLSEGPDAKMMRHCMDTNRGDEIRANCLFWFEFELRQYTSAPVDIEGLERAKEKLIFVAGDESIDGAGAGPIKAIAMRLGKEVQRIPGGHVGFMTVPDLFVKRILELLSE
ncbi:hypothetical protein FPOAC2_03838 [Fusarium poae]|uniref:hypothetical protein n=1 Tax=Fusarium poae TaxID=36050 RepID=UPI001CE815DF|nr:hypothetical protein FPOAC1_003762 [Fusarium poae]KAG8677734.1 hypothetical protein FPOAC1_003762 [Fusarium poae]